VNLIRKIIFYPLISFLILIFWISLYSPIIINLSDTCI